MGVYTGLECPECGTLRGVIKHNFGSQPGDLTLHCSRCECDVLVCYKRAGLKYVKCCACGADMTESFFDG